MTAAARHTPVSDWLPYPPTERGVRLYCLPHAGGSALTYRRWAGRLDDVAVCPVQPPGRGTRPGDEPHTSMSELADELAQVVMADAGGDRYAIFGHSLGALVGFELVRRIRQHGGPPPGQLLVSGCGAPQWLVSGDPTTAGGLTDSQIVALLRSTGGTPEVLLSDPRALRMIMLPIRADLTIRNTYRYRAQPPLDVPITVIAGTDDPRAGVRSMLAWRDQTVRAFRAYTIVGGHFAVFEQMDTTLGLVRRTLQPTLP